ncbi:MAG: ROK family protein, partial [Acholeplasmataceae bacterium]|nr:ROK family protein [Acholeplasmataceae bacterium]
VIGLGLAVPCPVKNGFVSQCANLSWENIHVINQMKKALPEHVNVVVSNDANSAAYGENMILEKPYQNAIFYTLGTGVGGGIILNGNIYEGTTGMAGEIGHMKIFGGLEDQPCGCGAQGCLEQVCGNQGIVRFAKQMLTNHESLLNDGRELSVKHIFEAAQLGDSVATSIVNRVAEHIAVSASVLAVVLDPEAFIIGGGIAKAGRFLIDKIEYYYKQNARFSTGKIPFVLAKTQNEAGIYGAAQLAKKKQ